MRPEGQADRKPNGCGVWWPFIAFSIRQETVRIAQQRKIVAVSIQRYAAAHEFVIAALQQAGYRPGGEALACARR